MNLHHLFKTTFFGAVIIVTLGATVITLFNNNKVRAAAPSSGCTATYNLNGFAWSENTGWISFNCNNDHDPNTAGVQMGSANYGVNIEPGGDLVGYAWSDNLGWVQFGGLSSFPSISGNTATDAKYNSTTGQVSGWARVVSGMVSSNLGKWDGWISLQGSTYGVAFSGTGTGTPKTCPICYAWGGTNASGADDKSAVIGWLDFSKVTFAPPAATVQLSANRTVFPCTTISPKVDLNWYVVGGGTVSSCFKSWDGSATQNFPGLENNVSVNPFPQTTKFQLTNCYSSAGMISSNPVVISCTNDRDLPKEPVVPPTTTTTKPKFEEF